MQHIEYPCARRKSADVLLISDESHRKISAGPQKGTRILPDFGQPAGSPSFDRSDVSICLPKLKDRRKEAHFAGVQLESRCARFKMTRPSLNLSPADRASSLKFWKAECLPSPKKYW